MPNSWPLQRDVSKFYGDFQSIGWDATNLTTVKFPWKCFYGTTPVKACTVHRLVAPSLQRVFDDAWGRCNHDQFLADRWHISRWSGSRVVRKMRGNAQWSMHSWGIAIDFDAGNNMLGMKKPFFTAENPLVRAFERECWIWGGRWKGSGIDAMHFQAARVA